MSLSTLVFLSHGRFAFMGSGSARIFTYIVSIRVKKLSKTNVVASRQVKGDNASRPVAVRRSKTRVLKSGCPKVSPTGVQNEKIETSQTLPEYSFGGVHTTHYLKRR